MPGTEATSCGFWEMILGQPALNHHCRSSGSPQTAAKQAAAALQLDGRSLIKQHRAVNGNQTENSRTLLAVSSVHF